MATLQENIETIKSATADIKTAIVDKGGTIEGDITTWANAIGALSGGGGLLEEGTKADLLPNKLDGAFFGSPTYDWQTGKAVLHTYDFSAMINFTVHLYPVPLAYSLGFHRMDNSGHFRNRCTWYIEQFCESGSMYIELDATSGELKITGAYAGTGTATASSILKVLVRVQENELYDTDYFYIQGLRQVCILKGTPITLADGTTKKIEDVTYNDKLKVWNFDEGKYDEANPLWIKKAETASYYYHCEFENGLTLDLVGSNGKCHRLFSVTKNSFESATDCVGDEIYTEQGITRLMSCEMIIGDCEYYNIITNYHMNMFANNILTSCRYNNIYPIKDMKFVVDKDREYVDYEKYSDIPLQFFVGMRLCKQTIHVEETNAYIANMLAIQKTLQDYEGNEQIETNPENVEVGWIDENGNVYGFQRYMLGQQNHGKLAQYICEKLNIEPQDIGGYERALELKGYVRFSKEYFAKDNTRSEINHKQYTQLSKFMKARNIRNIKQHNVLGTPVTITNIEERIKR